MGFDGQFAKYRADQIGLTSFIYHGSIIRDSRDFVLNTQTKYLQKKKLGLYGKVSGKENQEATHS